MSYRETQSVGTVYLNTEPYIAPYFNQKGVSLRPHLWTNVAISQLCPPVVLLLSGQAHTKSISRNECTLSNENKCTYFFTILSAQYLKKIMCTEQNLLRENQSNQAITIKH